MERSTAFVNVNRPAKLIHLPFYPASLDDTLSRTSLNVSLFILFCKMGMPKYLPNSRVALIAAIVSPPSFSRLELLPQELLVRVICGVNHEDLNSLSIVSKTIREASLEAKRLHFAYSTPKKSQAFRNSIVLENVSGSNHLVEDDLKPPNAPVRHRWTEAKRKEQLANVTVALFT